MKQNFGKGFSLLDLRLQIAGLLEDISFYWKLRVRPYIRTNKRRGK